MSSKLHPYSLQRSQSPPGPRIPKMFRNTNPRNCYDLKGRDIDLYFLFLFFLIEELYCELNYHDQKIRRTPTHDIRKHWAAVSILLALINSVYGDIHHWRSNHKPEIAELKLYNWAVHIAHKWRQINKSWKYNHSASCGRWFDLQWWRSRYTLLMKPNIVETAVQWFHM